MRGSPLAPIAPPRSTACERSARGSRGPDGSVDIEGRGLRGLTQPPAPLDARNSGTTMRLLAGVLAAHPFDTTIVGDPSLSCRPMRRVGEPLMRMGAVVETRPDGARR